MFFAFLPKPVAIALILLAFVGVVVAARNAWDATAGMLAILLIVAAIILFNRDRDNDDDSPSRHRERVRK